MHKSIWILSLWFLTFVLFSHSKHFEKIRFWPESKFILYRLWSIWSNLIIKIQQPTQIDSIVITLVKKSNWVRYQLNDWQTIFTFQLHSKIPKCPNKSKSVALLHKWTNTCWDAINTRNMAAQIQVYGITNM